MTMAQGVSFNIKRSHAQTCPHCTVKIRLLCIDSQDAGYKGRPELLRLEPVPHVADEECGGVKKWPI